MMGGTRSARATLAAALAVVASLAAVAGCGSREIIGDTGTDPWADPFDDPFADTGGGDGPDAADTIPADTAPPDTAPWDSSDAPWDFPEDGGGPDWTVPDFWDAPFDYMDVPPDYEPDAASCGNGVVDEGEECDDGNTVDHDECTNRCMFPRCGDGSTWWGWEDLLVL